MSGCLEENFSLVGEDVWLVEEDAGLVGQDVTLAGCWEIERYVGQGMWARAI
jgi:hypothetical protein